MFSKACEYGIRAAIHIAQQSQLGNRISLKEIAMAIDSPVAFTAKTLQLLAKNKIIKSVKGPAGGYEMTAEELDTIKLFNIVKAIDGDQIYNGCGLGLKACNASKPCPLHNEFKSIRDDLKHMLKSTSVRDLADGINGGLTFLKR